MTVASSTRTTLEMIKFEHSIFALPFALLGAVLAADGLPTGRQIFWIVVAMVGARNVAMTFNRLVDRDIDAQNPRTSKRALPAGLLSVRFAVVFLVASALIFLFAAWRLNPLALALAPVALAWICFYSYTKRLTWLSHIVLGLALGIAPAAAWIAVRGSLAPRILLLTAAVTLWVAGFDVLYACQDYEFDRQQSGLYSLPKRVGIANALRVALGCHVAMLALLVWLLRLSHLGPLAVVGLVLAALLIGYEHTLVKPHDLSRLNAAFFSVNGYVGFLLLVSWGGAVLLKR
ncbi:MAG: UbiA-like polyprenyltransferase [Terriglobales bacterium]